MSPDDRPFLNYEMSSEQTSEALTPETYKWLADFKESSLNSAKANADLLASVAFDSSSRESFESNTTQAASVPESNTAYSPVAEIQNPTYTHEQYIPRNIERDPRPEAVKRAQAINEGIAAARSLETAGIISLDR